MADAGVVAASEGGGALMRTRASAYLQFLAVFAVLGTLGIAGAVYVVVNQRVRLPLESAYTVKAEFSEADGVIAGLGQPVNVAGVKVGQVTGVDAVDG